DWQYVTRSGTTWMSHLLHAHFTTALLVECSLRCDCGYEAYSPTHECDIMNFTVVRKMERGRRPDEAHEDVEFFEGADMNAKRRQSRNTFVFVNYNESMDQSDGEVEPSLKKCKAESLEKQVNVRAVFIKPRLACSDYSGKRITYHSGQGTQKGRPSINGSFKAESVMGWELHLRRMHSTTPTLAGYLLRCDCGQESYANSHSYQCDIYNITIIQEEDKVIRRLVDCLIYPKTPLGYIAHLNLHHKTTLQKNGIYVKCVCGLKMFEGKDHSKHEENCDGRGYTLHRIVEE
ncbi:hypothetical protein PMAYCL1PPCAC_13928, partial [Pristionchus mayeri]